MGVSDHVSGCLGVLLYASVFRCSYRLDRLRNVSISEFEWSEPGGFVHTRVECKLYCGQVLRPVQLVGPDQCPEHLRDLSDAPFDWGWKAVDFASLTPRRRCSSVQNSDVNLGSRSLTIVSGSPCNRTTLDMNNGASSAAIVVVHRGIRCTRDVNLHSTTQI